MEQSHFLQMSPCGEHSANKAASYVSAFLLARPGLSICPGILDVFTNWLRVLDTLGGSSAFQTLITKKQQHSWNTMLNPVAANKYDSSLQTCPTSYFAGSPGVFGRLLAVSLGQLNAFPLLPHCNEHHHQRGRALAV